MKKVIDILGIVLPALIILLGIIRVFVKKTKGVNGLIMLFAILLLIAGLVRYFAYPDRPSQSNGDSKATPLTVSKHSHAFNQSAENMLTAYYAITDAFTKGDSTQINAKAAELKTALENFKIEELKVDTLIYQTALQPYENAKTELASIQADPSLDEKRASFNIFSNELFTLLSTVRYDLTKLFWQECGSAFGEEKPGNWISKSEQSVNPYGKTDCAEVRTTLNFVPADTTVKQ
jgi:hypothetical protein